MEVNIQKTDTNRLLLYEFELGVVLQLMEELDRGPW